MDSATCPICNNNPVSKQPDIQRDACFVICSLCGRYSLENSFEQYPNNEFENNKHLIAGYLYETNKGNRGVPIIINTKNCKQFFENEVVPKTASQKMEKMLVNLYYISNKLGHIFNEYSNKLNYQIGYARDFNEFQEMIIALEQLNYCEIIRELAAENVIPFKLTLLGMEEAERLSNRKNELKKVFVAMRFNDKMYKVLEKAIKPAVKECGFEAYIVSEEQHNDDINEKIIAGIKASCFVIVDLTYNNHGAYYEAGIAQGTGKKIIRTCKKSWFEGKDDEGNKNQLHFDVNHYNFILWKNVPDLKKQLIDRIKSTIL